MQKQDRRFWERALYSYLVGLVAIAFVQGAKAREVKVSSFGFDPEDSTRFIQAAIDSGAEKVIFDKMPSPWITLPLRGASKQELFFEPGVELVAKKGAFLGKEEALITFRDAEDVSLVGHGATLRMHKSDYFKPPYEKSEWRHALSIHSCRRVKIEGLAIRDSGGDAIYIGRKGRRKMPYCEDVVIRDVLCDGNNRQGISVISVKNLLIERCRLNNTSGSNPQAGIDFEPNSWSDLLQGIVMRDCEVNGNAGSGIHFALHKMRSRSVPVDALVENCSVDGNSRNYSFSQHVFDGDCVGGKVTARNCVFKNALYAGIYFNQKIPRSTFFKFENCRLENNCTKVPEYPDISFATSSRIIEQPEEVDFGNLTVVSPVERECVKFLYAGWNTQAVKTVTGKVVHKTPSGVKEIVFDDAGRKAFAPVRKAGPVHAVLDCSDVQVIDEAPGKMIKLTALGLRERMNYVFYASKAGVCNFRTKFSRLRRSKGSMDKVAVTPVAGGETEIFRLSKNCEELVVTVPAAGFYKMSILATKRNVFTLTHADVPVGILLDSDIPQDISSSLGSFYFHVKKGETFRFYASGSSYEERVNLMLRDSDKKVVWDRENLLFPEVVTCTAESDGLWSVKTRKPSRGFLEDYSVDLLDTQPVLFLSAKRYWKSR